MRLVNGHDHGGAGQRTGPRDRLFERSPWAAWRKPPGRDFPAASVGLRSIKHPPALLLGGVDLVRAAAWVACRRSWRRRSPTGPPGFALHAAQPVLPPLEQREAVMQAVLRAGARLARTPGPQVPLVYAYRRLPRPDPGRLRRARAVLRADPERARRGPARSWTRTASRPSAATATCRCRALVLGGARRLARTGAGQAEGEDGCDDSAVFLRVVRRRRQGARVPKRARA